MMRNLIPVLNVGAIAVAITLCVLTGAHAAAPTALANAIGKVVSFNGEARLVGLDPSATLKALSKVYAGDSVRSAEGMVKVLLQDDTAFVTGRNTDMRVDTVNYDRARSVREVELILQAGTMRVSVAPGFSGSKDVTVRTPAGDILIRHGDALLAVQNEGDQVQITVLTGEVYIAAQGVDAAGARALTPHTTTVAKADGSTAGSTEFSAETAKAMLATVDLLPDDLLQDQAYFNLTVEREMEYIASQSNRLYGKIRLPVYAPLQSTQSLDQVQSATYGAVPKTGSLQIIWRLPELKPDQRLEGQ